MVAILKFNLSYIAFATLGVENRIYIFHNLFSDTLTFEPRGEQNFQTDEICEIISKIYHKKYL